MGGTRLAVGIAILLLVVPTVPTTVGQSDGCGEEGCGLHVDRTVAGDYWVTEFRLDQWTTIQAGSTLATSLQFDNRTDETGLLVVLEEADGPVRFGAVVWIEGGQAHVDVRGATPADENDVHVDVDVTRSPRWDGVEVTIQWNVDQSLAPVDHRLVVAGPTADRLDLAVDLDTDEPVERTGTSAGSTGSSGALVNYPDWNATTAVRTQGFEVLDAAHAEVLVPADRRLYAFHGPATSGVVALGTCPSGIFGVCGAFVGGFGTTWGHTTYGLIRPDGSSVQREVSYPLCTSTTCPGSTDPVLALAGQPGTWRFTVAEHQAFGATPDVIAIAAPVQLPS